MHELVLLLATQWQLLWE